MDVGFDVQGPVGVIELRRPEKFNAMRRQGFEAMGAALDAFEDDSSGVRVVLIRAQGKHFCTGGDLIEAKAMTENPEQLEPFLRLVHDTLARLGTSGLPVVCSSQGLVLAGGLEIVLSCDITIAADDARFGDQHVHYGLVPAWGGTWRLPRAVGLGRSRDLLYSGRWIDAPTAHSWGLVHRVVPRAELPDATMDYCTELASRSRSGLASMKQLTAAGLQLALQEGLDQERREVIRRMAGPDPTEGVLAFEQRRAPRFAE